MAFMFSHGFWIRSYFGGRLGRLLLGFVQSYAKCAKLTFWAQANRFPLVPKLHFVHHTSLRIIWEASVSQWIISPLSTAVQQQEDYIGRPARLSRRVAQSRLLHVRVMERSLICAMSAILGSDRDSRGLMWCSDLVPGVGKKGSLSGGYFLVWYEMSWYPKHSYRLSNKLGPSPNTLHLSPAPCWQRSAIGSGSSGCVGRRFHQSITIIFKWVTRYSNILQNTTIKWVHRKPQKWSQTKRDVFLW